MDLTGNISVPVNGNYLGQAKDYTPSTSGNYDDYWSGGNIVSDWVHHQDTFAHNEALASWLRESTFNANEAEKARQFEKMMSDTQFQRKVQDYLKAGFSPLAALEGNGTYAVSSAPSAAAHAYPAKNGANNFGGILGALIGTIATIATHGVYAAVSKSGNAAKAALDAQKLNVLHDQVEVQKGWLDLAKNSKKGVAAAAKKVSKKASKGKKIVEVDWDKLLDDLEKL